MTVFRQKSWPIFDQDFGRFSAKVFGQFSPKTLADFRPKKSPIGQGPWALETPPFEATLAFPIFFGEPSKSSREASRTSLAPSCTNADSRDAAASSGKRALDASSWKPRIALLASDAAVGPLPLAAMGSWVRICRKCYYFLGNN